MVRNRNWVLAAVLVGAVVLAAAFGSRSKSTTDARAPGPQVHFGAHIQPPAGSDGSLQFNNGWIVASGTQAIAVYAGSAPGNRQNGLFLVQRHSGNEAQPRKTRTIVVHGSGALTLLRPPTPASESAASQTTLHFVTANGATGTLDLANDKLALSR